MSEPAIGTEVEPYEIRVTKEVISDLRVRLSWTRWPEHPAGAGWQLGTDLDYARSLCDHWHDRYDTKRLERLNDLGSHRWRGLHFLHVQPEAASEHPPVVLLHGWPSGPLEYARAARLVAQAGREAIVPSLPGFAWSEDPGKAPNVAAMAEAIRGLLEAGLGLDRYALAGGDWGGIIAARMAYDAPEQVEGLYVSTPGVLPTPVDLEDPPLSDDEVAYAERAQRWLRREGHHMVIQGLAPDVISPALTDSPAGLASYLVEKYRRWSDSGGDVERRFSKDDLCDFLTMFWSTGAITPSMRLYWGERRDRWRLAPGERIAVPAAIGVYPGDSLGGTDSGTLATLNPPREWSERILSDLRRWNVLPSGGHFAAFEEPGLYVNDLMAFLDDTGA